jgi:DNA polymerase-3 subunit gamma/tau
LDTIKSSLREAATELEVEADDDALFWIAKESTGSMRDAYTLFDQVVSFSQGHITMEKISSKLGLVGVDQIAQIVSYLLEEHTDQALLAVQDLLQAGVSVEQCIKDFTLFFRSLLFIKAGIHDDAILGVQSDRIPLALRNAYSSEQLEAAIELLLKLYREIRYSLNPRFELELFISRIGSLPSLASPTTLVKKITQMRDELLSGAVKLPPKKLEVQPDLIATNQMIKPSTKAVPSSSVAAIETRNEEAKEQSDPVKPAPVVSRPFTKGDLPALVSRLSSTPLLSQVAQAITDVDHEEGVLNLTFSTAFCQNKAEESAEKFRSLIKEISGFDGPIRFHCLETEKQEETPQTEDSVVSKIASIFRGEITQQTNEM